MRKFPVSIALALVLAWAMGAAASQGPQLRFAERPTAEEGHTFLLTTSAGCVEVDLELLPGPDPEGLTQTLSTEISNCGDDAALIDVEVTLDLNGMPLGPFTHHVYLPAGGSLVRSVTFVVPPVVPSGSYSLCVKAIIDEAMAEDCATLTVEAPVTASIQSDDVPETRFVDDTRPYVFLASANGCVEVDLELLPGPDPNGLLQTLSTEISNCGDEPSLVDVEVTLDFNGTTIGPFTHHVHLAAGGSLVRSVVVPVPALPPGTYSLCMKASIDGVSAEDCATLEVTGASATSVNGTRDVSLSASPNPFNAQTRVRYAVNESAPVRLDVYNLLGQHVITLVDSYATPGEYSVIWDGRNASGTTVASGTYFYKLAVGESQTVRQMTLLK